MSQCEAGVEIDVIRVWLGHASLNTTNRYAETTLHTKQVDLYAARRSLSGIWSVQGGTIAVESAAAMMRCYQYVVL
ncbi:MAG: hypothetical protein JO185_08120 [Acidobacteriaceae bacterium]|nr:hypothetical protein [Acidobacteriaceae bacterium]MBV9305536.1 hypothetical protein [Acidobacteriaceae bacterium]MBV9676284.1 hypothetical protein [Acidobacteriaceae bacterium]